jgi:NMD protein affecting ribosome stability and mRNA decay
MVKDNKITSKDKAVIDINNKREKTVDPSKSEKVNYAGSFINQNAIKVLSDTL